jgi:hypothetical protein
VGDAKGVRTSMPSSTWPYVVVYVAAGLLFLGAAVYLQATRNLAISNADGHDALAIQYKDFKLQTLYPVVALFVIAFACTIVVPIVIATRPPVPENGTISVRAPVRPRNVTISTPPRTESGDPTLLVYHADAPIEYVLQGDKQHTDVTVSFQFDGSAADPRAEITSQIPAKSLTLRRIGTKAAEILDEIDLPLKVAAAPSSPPNVLSRR